MKKYNVLSMVFNIFAIILFVAGIILTTSSEGTTQGIVFIPAGFLFLFTGIYFGRKAKATENEKKKENE